MHPEFACCHGVSQEAALVSWLNLVEGTLNLVARSCLAVEIWQEIYSGRRP